MPRKKLSENLRPAKWKTLGRTELLNHPRLQVVEDDVELPNGHHTKYVRFLGDAGGVTIICVRGKEVLLQKEYSYPPNEIMYQFPGGKIEAGEDTIVAGMRELAEESGYTSDKCEMLGWYYPNNRRSASKMHVLLVKDPQECEMKSGDMEEFIESEWVNVDALTHMISSGEIVNFSILAGWTLWQARQAS